MPDPTDPTSSAPLPLVRSVDLAVVVPSCGDPGTLVPGVRRMLQHDDGRRVRVIVVLNPDRPERAAESRQMIDAARAARPDGPTVEFVELPGPAGFAAAVNAGVARACDAGSPPPFVAVVNDDVRVTAGWIGECLAAFDATEVVCTGDAFAPDGSRPRRPASLAVGRIGMVGPCSDVVAGVQRDPVPPEAAGASPDQLAWRARQTRPGEVVAVDFLSGFCLFVRAEALLDLVGPENARAPLLSPDSGRWALFDERFGVGGYEDNDLCARAEIAGWGRAVARSAWVQHAGHQTLDRLAPGARRGLANVATYLSKWRGHPRITGRTVCALYRVKLETAQDVAYLRQSLFRTGELCDRVAILLTGNPLDVQASDDWRTLASALPIADHDMLRVCGGADATGVADAVRAWAKRACDSAPASLQPIVDVEVWTGAWNERDERNRLIEVGEATGCAWLLSVDHDEVVEPRVDRALLDRWLAQPDPLVQSYDVAFQTLWDSPRLQRIDRPWGDGGAYTGGMRGFRLWRASASALRPRRIAGGNAIGLHCGNCPDADPLAKRVSSLRFRHLGYLRFLDRVRKHKRYQRLDPSPDAAATGGGYGHLVREEGMILAPVVSVCGVGLTMLFHEGETEVDLARQLDAWHGIADAVALVWTGAWDDDDPSTGPSADVRAIADLYGARWARQALDDDFAAARNAGIDLLRVRRSTAGAPLGWALVVDPDELCEDPFGAAVALRRCAECSDAYGFLQRFANHRPNATGEQPTISEAIRLVRLDPDGLMRYSGRIHEGFDRAFDALRATGEDPRLRYTPFTVHNHGLGLDDVALERKTRFYQRLLLLQLADNPRDAGAWTSLGMQYVNDGFVDRAVECFQRAVASDPGGYLPFRELGLHHLRTAKTMFEMVARLLPPAHPYATIARQGFEWLSRFAPEQPLVGLARLGPDHVPPDADVPLPDFPPLDPGSPFAGTVGGPALDLPPLPRLRDGTPAVTMDGASDGA